MMKERVPSATGWRPNDKLRISCPWSLSGIVYDGPQIPWIVDRCDEKIRSYACWRWGSRQQWQPFFVRREMGLTHNVWVTFSTYVTPSVRMFRKIKKRGFPFVFDTRIWRVCAAASSMKKNLCCARHKKNGSFRPSVATVLLLLLHPKKRRPSSHIFISRWWNRRSNTLWHQITGKA